MSEIPTGAMTIPTMEGDGDTFDLGKYGLSSEDFPELVGRTESEVIDFIIQAFEQPANIPDPEPAPLANEASNALPIAEEDFTASEALRTPAFWLIAFGHGFTSMVILAIMAHLGLLMVDKGYELQDAAFVVSVYTAVAMGFQLVGGYVGGKIPIRLALAFFTSMQALGVVVLVFADAKSTFYLFAVLFGAGFGGRNPLTVAIRGDYFGSASFGKILGFSTVPMNLLLLIAAPLVGWMRDVQGDYTQAFMVMVVTNMIGATCFILAKKPMKKTASMSTAVY